MSDDTMPADEIVPAGRVSVDVAALSHPGLVRPANEDSFAVFRMGRFMDRIESNVPEAQLPSHTEETGHLMIVADGLGGHAAGEVASKSALIATMQLILRSPRWALKLDDPETRDAEIAQLVERARKYLAGAHAIVRAQAAADRELTGMGTTLTSAYSVGNDLFVLHIGDSRAYLLRRGRLIRITHDHTIAQSYADQGLIAQDEVEKHRLGHVLTRAVGAGEDNPESDMHHLDLEHDDRLVLCSDGLTRTMNEDEISAILSAHAESAAVCSALVTRALEGGAPDNVTVIVARYSIEGAAK